MPLPRHFFKIVVLIILMGFSTSEAQSLSKPKPKVNFGVDYSVYSEVEYIGMVHQVGMVIDYRRLQFLLGGNVVFDDELSNYSKPIGRPTGLYFNVHYANGKKEAAFKFTFDFMVDYLKAYYSWDYELFHPTGITSKMSTTNTELRIYMGPGAQVRITKGLNLKLCVSPSLFEATNQQAVVRNGQRFIQASGPTTTSVFLPLGVFARVGLTYVFEY